MNVRFIPESLNPYHALLANGLASHGVSVSEGRFPANKWLLKNRQQVQILHLHWPHVDYTTRTSALITFIRAALFVQRIILAWIVGYKLVWTVHNLSPHENIFPIIDKFVHMTIVVLAKAIIIHCQFAKEEFFAKYRRRRAVFVIPIGHYDIYPIELSKAEARHALGLDEFHFVYLYFGVIRPYKGVEELLNQFADIEDEQAIMLVVGNCRDEQLCEKLKTYANQDTRIQLHLEWVADEEVQQFLVACDVMVAPFRNILTSSSVMLGMSFGRPVVAPALGCLPELVTPDSGVLYDPQDPDGLVKAMNRVNEMDLAKMGEHAHRVSHALDWDTIGEQTYQVYMYCLYNHPDHFRRSNSPVD